MTKLELLKLRVNEARRVYETLNNEYRRARLLRDWGDHPPIHFFIKYVGSDRKGNFKVSSLDELWEKSQRWLCFPENSIELCNTLNTVCFIDTPDDLKQWIKERRLP